MANLPITAAANRVLAIVDGSKIELLRVDRIDAAHWAEIRPALGAWLRSASRIMEGHHLSFAGFGGRSLGPRAWTELARADSYDAFCVKLAYFLGVPPAQLSTTVVRGFLAAADDAIQAADLMEDTTIERGEIQLAPAVWRSIDTDQYGPRGDNRTRRLGAIIQTAPPQALVLTPPVIRPMAPLPPPEQVQSIADLQVNRVDQTSTTANGKFTLSNYNPAVGAWYVLHVALENGKTADFHLEVATPRGMARPPELKLDGELIQVGQSGVWSVMHGSDIADELKAAAHTPYAELTSGLYVRNQLGADANTLIEAAGNKVRGTRFSFLSDLGKVFLGSGSNNVAATGGASDPPPVTGQAPPTAHLDPANPDARSRFSAADLRLAVRLVGAEAGLAPGEWYPVAVRPNVCVSIVRPSMIVAPTTPAVDGVYAAENPQKAAETMAYVVAFPLDEMNVSYVVGAGEPNAKWAGYVGTPAAKGRALPPGPDGIDTLAPLKMVGLVPPAALDDVVTTFNAGYEAWDMRAITGPMAERNYGTHWGFVQNGVVMRKLQAGLATAVSYLDGRFDIIRWPEDDRDLRARVKDARQNGVLLLDDHVARDAQPSASWGDAGNSVSYRSAMGVVENGGRRYLIFVHSPAASLHELTAIFRAYGCKSAMLLDTFVPRTSHLPFYKRSDDGSFSESEFLEDDARAARDGSGKLEDIERNDLRDFFYITQRRK